MQEISFGPYAIPVILMVVLAFIYKLFDRPDGTSSIPNRLKPMIAIVIGIGLGIVGMFYNGIAPTFKTIVDYVLYGFMTGASAIGLWEGFKAIKSEKVETTVKSILILLAFAVMISGCASMQTQVIDISQQGVSNAETSRTVAKNILSTWQLNSGFLKMSIGEELPGKTISAMEILDAIAVKCPKPDQCEATDYELGISLAAWAKVWTKVVETTITKIMKFIPSL